MSFVLQYKNLIESEVKLSKSQIKPRNIYRILVYEYADGERKSLAGAKSTLVFVVGIFEKQLFCFFMVCMFFTFSTVFLQLQSFCCLLNTES